MTNHSDLKGLATWDDFRLCWTPKPGKQDEVAAKLGPTWVYDSYFGSFFGADPEPATDPSPAYSDFGYICCANGATRDNDSAPRLVESKALGSEDRVLPLFDEEPQS